MDNNLLTIIGKFIFSLFSGSPKIEVTIPLDAPAPEPRSGIDWTDASAQVTEHFTVSDCLMLHSWNRLATEQDGADFNKLVALCNKMETIREILDSGINIHCMFRSQDYNKAQGIRPQADVHSMNLAADFDVKDLTIQQVKDKLEPLLDQLDMRMEKGTTTWVHLDLHPVGPSGRYFTA